MNKKLKCIIIDDERKDIENLKMLLGVYCPQVDVIGQASKKNDIIQILTEAAPDLVFLDINIGAICIFDILNELTEINFNIVFVSAHDKYAVEGYKYDAIDYMLKPVNPDDLVTVVNKALKLQSSASPRDTVMKDLKSMYTMIREIPKICVNDSKGMHIIKIPDLLYCLSRGNYTVLMMMDETEIIISKNLKYFEQKLQDFDFFRIHRSYVVNLNHISLLMKELGGSVLMRNGESLPIGRSAKKALFEKIGALKL